MGGAGSTASRWSSYLDRLLCDHDLFTSSSAIVEEEMKIFQGNFGCYGRYDTRIFLNMGATCKHKFPYGIKEQNLNNLFVVREVVFV